MNIYKTLDSEHRPPQNYGQARAGSKTWHAPRRCKESQKQDNANTQKSLPNSKGEKENFLEDKGYARRGPRRRRVRGKRSTPESSLAEGVNKTTTSNEEEFIPQFLS